MRIAALVKQIPAFEEMTLGSDGRLVREGLPLELNAYCRRAVSKAVELAAERPGSDVTVVTLGPPSADDALREAIAWGLDRGVTISGVLVSDLAFAGSDTIATARAMAAALEREGPFDLVLCGRNSVDADTGQVPPQIAALLDLPFLAAAKQLTEADGFIQAGCEHDDGWVEAEVALPAIVSCAERLCEPAKVPHEERAAVPAELIRVVTAADLGPGPWGVEASRTRVGRTRTLANARARQLQADAPLAVQVRDAARILRARNALDREPAAAHRAEVAATDPGAGRVVAVVAEPDRDHATRELVGEAARLAESIAGTATLVSTEPLDADRAGSWGADQLLVLQGSAIEEDVAVALCAWARTEDLWAILAPSTVWGREVAGRVAVGLDAGLTGDAVALEVDDENRLVAWKPAFGGQLVAAIHASSPVQMATVRAGVLPLLEPRAASAKLTEITIESRGRVAVKSRTRNDDLDVLAEAPVVVGVGQAVDPADYHQIQPLIDVLGARWAATRKVTDKGWMPRARQVGITGRSISPRLYVMIGASGKFNHSVGVRAADTVLVINPDVDAPAWNHADVGIVAEWQEAVPLLVEELARLVEPGPAGERIPG